MAIPDEGARHNATNKATRTKVKVKKAPVARVPKDAHDRQQPTGKRPPVPVPDIAATWAAAPKPPKPPPIPPYLRRRQPPPRREGFLLPPTRHLPRDVTRMSPEQWATVSLGRKLSTPERAALERYNQRLERERRDIHNRAKEVQRAKKTYRGVEKLLGEGQDVADYIEHGKRDTSATGMDMLRGAVGLGEGALSGLHGATYGRVSGGLRNASTMRERETGLGGVETMSDWIIGPELTKLMQGDDFNPYMAGLEMGLMFTPGKGIPSVITRLLRGARGGAVAIKEFRAGMSAAQAARVAAVEGLEPIRPIHRAGQGIRRGASAARRALPYHGQPKGPNWRTLDVNGATFREPAAQNPIGQAVEKAVDTLRTKTGWTTRKAGQFARKGMQVDTQTESIALTRLRRLGRKINNPVEWKALQLMAENVSPSEAAARDLANAARSSDKLIQYNLHTHARLSADAAKYVVWDPVAQRNVWTKAAPQRLRLVDDAMHKGSEYREGVLEFYEVLGREAMNARIDAPAKMTDEWIGLQDLEDFAAQERGSILDAVYRTSLNDPTLEHLTGNALEDAARERALANIGRLDAMAIAWASQHNLRARSARQVFADRLMAQEGRELPDELPEWMRDVTAADFYKGLRAVLAGFPDDEIARELERFPNHLMQAINEWAFTPKNEGLIAGGLKRVNTKAELAKRYAPGGDLYKPDVGLAENARVVQKVGRQNIHVIGEISVEDWVKRVKLVFGNDFDQIDEAARWYEFFDGVMRHFFGDDAEAIMRGFAVSQANASPKDGLGAVLKILYKVRRGEEVGEQEASVVGGAIRDAIKGETVSKGMRAKLHDFADSLEGKGTRTWLDDVHGELGWPTANDVHAMRDLGYVDQGIAERLRTPAPDSFMKEGIDDFVIDSAGSPSDHQYQRMVEKYAAITKHLNKIEFGGRKDWNPSQVQALGWSAIQKFHGTEPETLRAAVLGNTWQIDTELTKGVESLGADLTVDETIQVAKEMEAKLIELVNDTADVYLIPEFKYTTGGWEQGQNGVMQFKVVGSQRAIEDLTVRIARAFDQEWVQASRRTSAAAFKPKSALVLAAPEFADETVKQRFFERLTALSPKSRNPATRSQEVDLGGYSSIDVDGVPAIVIRTHRSPQTGKGIQPFVDRYTSYVDQAAKEAGIKTPLSSHQNLALITGTQDGVEDALKTGRGTGRSGGVDDHLAAQVRQELEAAIERIRSSRGAGSGDQGLRSSAAARGGSGAEDALDPLSRPNYHTVGEGDWKAGDLFRAREGWQQAITRLEDGTVPVEFIRGVMDDPSLSVHQKAGVLQYLDKQTGGELSRVDLSRTFGDALGKLVGAKRLRGSYRYPGHATDAFGSIGRHEGAVILSETQTRSGTPAHELFHYAHKQGLIPEDAMSALMRFIKERNGEPSVSPWTRENDEDLVHVLEVYLLAYGDRGIKPRGMSMDAHKALTSISAWMKTDDTLSAGQMYGKQVERYGKKQRILGNEIHTPELPPEITEVLDALHISPRKGRNRIHYMRSLPVPLRKDLLKNRQALGNRIAYARGRGNAVGAMWSDPTTRKAFQGYLLKTGAYAADVIRSNEASIAKAVRLHQAHEVRNMFTAAGKDIPGSVTDWPFKLDPGEKIDPAFREVMDKLAAIDESLDLDMARKEAGVPRKGIKKFLLRKHDLDRIKWDQIDAWQKELYPNQVEVDGKLVSGMDAARTVMETGTPIPNIVWVPDSLIRGSHLLDVPKTLSIKRGDFGPIIGAGARIVDAVNDAMRISLLYMNPAYYGMNLLGNGALMLMHQGWATPFNVRRSVMAHWQLGDDIKTVIDNYMGEGPMSIASLRSWHGGKNQISNLANFLVDRIPRRSAWLHEARKLGYKEPDDIVDLITRAEARDAVAREHVDYITRRAKDSMVDFDNLTPIERDVISRIIFVYPWIKGSFRWTLRFPLNHPVQATAYSLLYMRQQELAGEEVPERPGYMDLFFPITGMERFGEEMVYGFNPKQLIPASQPYDMAHAVLGWFTGDMSTSPLTEYSQPMWSAILSRFTGYDPFSDEKVQRSFTGLLGDIGKQLDVVGIGDMTGLWESEAPGVKNVRAAVSDKSNEGRLYPRRGVDEWIKVFLGSLAPTPVDPDVAAKYAREEKGAKRTALDRIEKEEKLVGTQMPPRIRAVKALKAREAELQQEEREASGQSDLADWQLVLAKAKLLNEAMGSDVVGIDVLERDLRKLDKKMLARIEKILNERLDYGADDVWNRAVRIAQDAAAEEAAK